MSATKEQLERFSRFAEEQLKDGGADHSLEQLLWLWRDANGDDVQKAIREGLEDFKAGRYRALDKFMDEFRKNPATHP